MKQYEIWWADLPSPVGRRPVPLLTRSAAYAYLNKAIVAEITTTIRGIPQEVPVGEPEGLVPSVANRRTPNVWRTSSTYPGGTYRRRLTPVGIG
jgi:mRNA-degrading endonuclease toxin of MazEF toxin-antitoxin module